jgi:predicted AlkP superfamily phosphohydrolase/phosphomutase
MLRLVDDHLGRLATRLGDGVVLAVAGDHGMVGVDRTVRPNAALAGAGLLAFDARGAVDLAKTQAVYGPGNFVVINRASRRGGTVRPEDEAAVVRRVREALLGIRDPATGAKVILSVVEPGRPGEPTFGGPAGGDLYVSAAPGYFVARQLHGALVEPMSPSGEHFIDPEHPSMHAGFAIAGPGVAAGASLGAIREIDVAPTLAALLGIEPPAQATGKVLEAALARKQARPPAR